MSTSMNPGIKAQWIAALRSGQYKQGTSRLRRIIRGEDRYCCLGILCELAVQAGAITPPTRSNGEALYRYGEDSACLPNAVSRWSGLNGFSGLYIINGSQSSLVENNDKGMTFDQIADTIERHF